MAVFSGSELVDIALGIERNGVVYYSSLAESTTHASLKDAYNYLANMEQNHIKTFQKMLDQVGKYQPTYAGEDEAEYELYLKALVDSAVFTNGEVARQTARKASGWVEAIQMALGAEKDSILFYNEMRELVPERERPVVDEIINEEKSHIRLLSDIKKKFA
jgi:rubrerythrin